MEAVLIEFIGSDIGGTLTDENGGISDRTRRVVARLPVPFCLVTGFNRHVAFRYRDQFQSDNLYLIAQNGSFTYRGEELLSSNLLDASLVEDIVAFILSADCVARVFCTDNNVYCLVPDGYNRKIRRWDEPVYRFFNRPLSELPSEVIQVGVFEPVSIIQRLMGPAVTIFGDVCMEGPMLFGTHQWLEFNHPDAKKEIAFPRLLDMLGVSLENAMYCGDNYNDLALLKKVGYPVAVADAVPEVRAVAKQVTGPGFEDGISEFLVREFGLESGGSHESD
ncbi:MAG: hypothetical protein DRJ14_08540 [Acidobacteria bacterium]|nr:MAG: hypothetical protein DRJ14_08540 [Acidobacteriota bacterium]